MTPQRRTVRYEGHVQGVGFRWTTVAALRGLDVAGYVRNLPDGAVELVLEGADGAVAEATRRVREALSRHIAHESERLSPATGEFAGFGIRR